MIAAVARALVGWGRLAAAEPGGNVLRHYPGGGFGEYACLGHRQTCHFPDRIDVRDRVDRFARFTGTQPSTARPELSTTSGTR